MRLTAFDMDITTKMNRSSAPTLVMSNHWRSLTKEIVSAATVSFSGGALGNHSAATPQTAPTIICPSSFFRFVRPRLFFLRTLRKSSRKPTRPRPTNSPSRTTPVVVRPVGAPSCSDGRVESTKWPAM